MAVLIPDITVSLAAMAGLVLVLWHLEGSALRDGLTTRFRCTLWAAVVFLGARVLVWLGFDGAARGLTYGTAACLPLLVFLLAEGLIRRHAPLWAKGFVAVATGGLVLAALWPGATLSVWFLSLLFGFQLAGFGLAGWLIWSRDPADLSAVENARIRHLSLSLLVILPFLVTDYRFEGMDIPVRLSGLAILVTCWLALTGQRESALAEGWQRGLLLLWPVALASVAAIAIGWQFSVPLAGIVQVWAMVLSLLMVFELGRMAAQARRVAQSGQMLADLAVAAQHPFDRFLDVLRLRAADEGALIMTAAELSSFDTALLRKGMGASGRVRVQDLPRDAGQDSLAQSQLRLLMARFGAGSVHLVAADPLVLAVIRSDGLAGADPSPELCAAFAMARLIADRDAARPFRQREKAS